MHYDRLGGKGRGDVTPHRVCVRVVVNLGTRLSIISVRHRFEFIVKRKSIKMNKFDFNDSNDIKEELYAMISYFILIRANIYFLLFFSIFVKMQRNRISEYTVIKKLGEGSYGRVYLVESPKKQLYALKSI